MRHRKQPGEGRQRLLSMAPLLLAALTLSQAAAAGVTMTAAAPGFRLTLHLAILAGYGLSAIAILRGRDNALLAGVVAVLATVAARLSVARFPIALMFFPDEVTGVHETTVATLFCWLLVAWALLQSRRDCLFLPVVTGLAIFGLMGTLNLSGAFLLAFLVYLFATVYAWGYERLVGLPVAVGAGAARSLRWTRLAMRQLAATTLLVAVVCAASLGLAGVLYRVVPSIWGSWQSLQFTTSWAGAVVQGTFLFTDEVPVGRGPVKLSQMEMFRVQSSEPALWRGRVYDQYTGAGWRRRMMDELSVPPDPAGNGFFTLADAWAYPGRPLRQVFTVISVTASGIVGATHPVSVRTQPSIHGAFRRGSRVKVDRYGALEVASILLPGSQYEVVSNVPSATPEQLRAAGEGYSPIMRHLFIDQYPYEVKLELQELAVQITAGAPTPYDKVQAILAFLREGYAYTLSAPATPHGQDAVVHFLKESKRGACDSFSSAAAILCRLSGVPARLATGYAEGEYDSSTGEYVVRALDAHAWIEVFFPGYGWIPFNPHSAYDADAGGLLATLRLGEAGEALLTIGRGLLVIGFALFVGYLLSSSLIDPQALWQTLVAAGARSGTWGRIGVAQSALTSLLLSRAGRRYSPSVTPLEALELARANLSDTASAAEIESAISELYRLRYRPERPAESELRQLLARLRAARRRISTRRR